MQPRCKREDTSCLLVTPTLDTVSLSFGPSNKYSRYDYVKRGDGTRSVRYCTRCMKKKKGNHDWLSLSAVFIVACFSAEAYDFVYFYFPYVVTITAGNNGRILRAHGVALKDIIPEPRCTNDNYRRLSECYRLSNRLFNTTFNNRDSYLLSQRKSICSSTITKSTTRVKLYNSFSLSLFFFFGVNMLVNRFL